MPTRDFESSGDRWPATVEPKSGATPNPGAIALADTGSVSNTQPAQAIQTMMASQAAHVGNIGHVSVASGAVKDVSAPDRTPAHIGSEQELRGSSMNASPIHQQVAAPLLNLRARGDGAHTVLLELHPADLGPVSVQVRIEAGAMSIAIISGSDEARANIRTALPELRNDLLNAGVNGVAVSVDSGSAGGSAGQGRQPHAAERYAHPSAPTADVPATRPAQSPLGRPSHPDTGIDRWL